MTAFPTYSTGTVAVANGAIAITGTGSNWTGANAKPGDDIVVDGHTVVVLDVTDATHLAIDAWPYTSVVAGASYKIIKRSPLRFVGGDAMADVSTLVAALNTDGFYVFVGPTETVPDPSFGEEDQFALQPSTGKLWLKTGGVWVFQGIYKGFNITGAWSGATAYAVGDVVSLSGSSYVALADNTNQTPPNATYWQVLAAKGDQGIQGASYGGTSTTSLTIGTGSKAFTTQAGLAYLNGARVRASSTANTSNWMEGLVTYSGTTLTMTSNKTNGSGTIASWNLNIVGEPGAGDLTSANNLSDLANAATARDNLGVSAVGALNILDFGGVGDGTTANDAAFNAAYAALGTFGGCIYFPAGKYKFTSAIAKTFPLSQFALTLAGDGSNSTTLYWPNASGGIEFTTAHDRSTFHLRDFTFETNQANGGTGFKANGTHPNGLTGFFWQSEITDVDFAGSDRSIGIGTKCWSTAIHIHLWSCVTLTNVNTWGLHGNIGDAGGGTGLLIEGDTATANYVVIINCQACSFNSHAYGVNLGSYWQGITFNQCNFNGRVGSSAITSSGSAGVQVLLSLFNCQIDYAGGAALFLGGSLTNVLLQGNLIAAYGNGGIAVYMPDGGRLQATGNSIGQFGAFTGTFGIAYGGDDGVISDNIFSGLASPVNLLAASSNVGLSNNRYSGTGANINNGTNNDMDVIAALQASVVSATGTTSATQVMMGLGSTFKITPLSKTRVHLTISGDMLGATAVLGSLSVMYGTGTAPVNGAASTGTQVGATLTDVPNSTTTQSPFSKTVIITGLVPNTAYWFDVKLSSNNGVSVSLGPTDCAVFEF